MVAFDARLLPLLQYEMPHNVTASIAKNPPDPIKIKSAVSCYRGFDASSVHLFIRCGMSTSRQFTISESALQNPWEISLMSVEGIRTTISINHVSWAIFYRLSPFSVVYRSLSTYQGGKELICRSPSQLTSTIFQFTRSAGYAWVTYTCTDRITQLDAQWQHNGPDFLINRTFEHSFSVHDVYVDRNGRYTTAWILRMGDSFTRLRERCTSRKIRGILRSAPTPWKDIDRVPKFTEKPAVQQSVTNVLQEVLRTLRS